MDKDAIPIAKRWPPAGDGQWRQAAALRRIWWRAHAVILPPKLQIITSMRCEDLCHGESVTTSACSFSSARMRAFKKAGRLFGGYFHMRARPAPIPCCQPPRLNEGTAVIEERDPLQTMTAANGPQGRFRRHPPISRSTHSHVTALARLGHVENARALHDTVSLCSTNPGAQ